ncbi:MAG: respiratory nitrate reductase subunit gamma [Acidobacteria bacterium]|jgi:nitrate reductase gamma subunit|nr:respiratory nitrate reductase subunit gamma [Acidobacteriota bacterium]
MLNVLLFAAFPYVSVVLFLVVSIQRYRRDPFTFSSLSSQFLESKELFWGSVPFHLGILTLFFGHLVGFLFPRGMTLWNLVPLRLFVLESTALAAALLTLFGLAGLILRRAATSRLHVVTSPTDVLVYTLLLFEIVTGLWVAIALRWGSAWYTQTVVPYLWSLARFQPDIQRMVDLKLPAQMHVVGAFVLIAAFSFTRLVHALVAPVPYLWRPNQLVIWNRARGAVKR